MGNSCFNANETDNDKLQTLVKPHITPQFLITAYTHSIERISLHNQIIPDTIITLCVEYYYTETFPIFSFQSHGKLFINRVNFKRNELQNFDVEIQHPVNSKLVSRLSLLSQESALLHRTENIILPKQLENLYKEKERNSCYNHTIFKCGGSLKPFYGDRFPVNYCHMIMIDKNQLELNNYNITAYQYDLPSLPIDGSGNNVIFNNKSGLYSIGGEGDSASYFLEWKSMLTEDWKWEIFNNGYIYGRCPYSVNIDHDNKILIFGNIDYTMQKASKNQIYDIDTKTVITVSNNHIKLTSGITPIYDDKLEMVYLCGAAKGSYQRHIECYDINKDNWYHIATTKSEYIMPKFWMIQKDILYVVDLNTYQLKTVEYLDLRENNRKWNIINLNKLSVKQLFGDGWKLCT